MTDIGKLGDKVGYSVLRQVGGEWAKTPSVTFHTIGQAVEKAGRYQDRWPTETFAVARLELVMIIRPEEDA